MIVDLRSDTVTRPSAAMRQAMANAEVGDDVFGDDPTVNRLQDLAAELVGKEAALFCTSGTQANQIAIRLHTRPGDAVLMEAGAHPYNYESGAPAQLSGVTIRPIQGERGVLDPAAITAAFPPVDPHFSPVTLVTAEDTANRGGGTVYPLDVLDAVAAAAHAGGARAHLDGARLFNAAIKSGVPAHRRAQAFDTVSICLSKGLGAPVGSLICGPRDLIERGKWVRKALGGAMRQAGIVAAGGLYALQHNIERLAMDHVRAERLAEGLAAAGYQVQAPETNMVYFTIPDASAAAARMEERGVRCVAVGPDRIRLVTHLDVDDAGIERAIAVMGQLR